MSLQLQKPALYYFNALFDLQLGGFPVGKNARAASEMTTMIIPLGSHQDFVVIDCVIPEDYREYLDSCGIACPKFVKLHQYCPGTLASPWGWNDASLKLLSHSGAQCDCPEMQTVKKINSRRFCWELGREASLGVPGSQFCETIDQFETALKSMGDCFPLVCKPEFGGAGFGLIKLEQREIPALYRERILKLFSNGGIVVEPWCRRKNDLSASLDIKKDGTFENIRYHRCHIEEHGAFVAVDVSPENPIPQQWRAQLEKAILTAAQAVCKEGYFGHIGFDSFTYINNAGHENLAAIIEINARHVISDIAYAVRAQCAPKQFCSLRLLNGKRIHLPETYVNLKERLDKLSYDPIKQEGIIILTPLRIEHNGTVNQPIRNAFFIAATDQKSLQDRDSLLRKLFSK